MPKLPPTFTLLIDGCEVRVHRQPRRTFRLTATPLGLVAFIPARVGANHPQLLAFLREHIPQLRPYDRAHAPARTTPDALRGMVEAWAARMDVQPRRVSLREMYRKWGSCSGKGTVTLSTALLRVPPALAEYVVVHELAHLREANHGAGWQALMTATLPDWRERDAALQRWLTDAAS